MNIDFEKCGGLVPAIIQDADTKTVLMLGYMNEEAYPGKIIPVKELTVQGVAEYVIKKLRPGGGGSSWTKRL